MSEQRNRESLLGGCRVLDVTNERGLLCGKIPGDLGADVIKVEPPGGDPARSIGPFYKDIPDPQKSLFWFCTNLNKRGITLNLETADGRDIFQRLVKAADFVIESFEPGYMASLGLGYSDLEKVNPELVMTSITPFGQTGPFAHYKATDLIGAGMGGHMMLYAYPDSPPLRISAPQFYFQGSIHGALGSMVAHYHRELTGEGQHVDVSCQQAVALTLMSAAEYWDILKVNYRGAGEFYTAPRPTPLGPLKMRWTWPCKDGYVALAHLSGGAVASYVNSSTALVQIANQGGFAIEFKDYDWRTYDRSKTSQEFQSALEGELGDFLKTKTKAELLDEALRRAILLIPVTTAKDIAESPQLAAREFFVQVEHPELGQTITYPGFPIKLSETPHHYQRRSPLIGEHNLEIYEGELGLSRENLTVLKARGII